VNLNFLFVSIQTARHLGRKLFQECRSMRNASAFASARHPD